MTEPIQNGENRDSKGKFVSGNSASKGKGRPKGTKSIPDILRRIGQEEDRNGNNMEKMCRKVWELGINGERWAVEWLANRMEGMPTQTTLTTTKELPIGFELNEI